MARRRVRKRFVLTLLAATLLAGMLAATAWTWRFEWPGCNDPAADLFDNRAIGCWWNYLRVFWVAVPIPDGRTSGADPLTADDVKKVVARIIREEECAEAEKQAGRELMATTAGFRRLAPGGWVFMCRLWLVRSVLGGLLALTLWSAWRTRPHWPLPHCQRCGYDRAGLAASAACPECGTLPR
ncbi:MAG TPA: hypothetical protein VHC70_00745 [Phycisphaerales bacterium]|nr:hypothetical protein [Phycisphaerales bacterium]